MNTQTKTMTLLDPVLVKPAIAAAFAKLDPRVQWRNPVMFVVYIGSILTTFLWLQSLQGQGEGTLRLYPGCRGVAVVHRAVRQLRRSHGRRPQQGAGRIAARAQEKHLGQEILAHETPCSTAPHGCPSRLTTCAAAMWCWSKPAT
jgi:hypothetical protein